MIKKINNRGFTLAEVLISTIVMSMIMGSVLAFVQYAGDIWHKGNEKISTDNYSRMAFEYIKQELLECKDVSKPDKSEVYPTTDTILRYKKENCNYVIKINEENILIKQKLNDKNAVVVNSKPVKIARNVANFYVNRLASRTLEISIQIKKEQNEDELEYEDGNPVYEIVSSDTMVLLAPGVD